MILYQALTGELPFEGESLAGLLYAIGHSEARLGWSVPAPLRHVCTKALSKDLALRYADAAEFADALRAAR
ncbi:MAG TPA: serine/threonine protein kinase, partial [Planctomycetes bacterium]|nr:serine/threonine protein kinase [Planctomycetota bacterium]